MSALGDFMAYFISLFRFAKRHELNQLTYFQLTKAPVSLKDETWEAGTSLKVFGWQTIPKRYEAI